MRTVLLGIIAVIAIVALLFSVRALRGHKRVGTPDTTPITSTSTDTTSGAGTGTPPGGGAGGEGSGGGGGGTSATPGKSVTLSLTFGGAKRSYILHIPTGYTTGKKYPLMLSYHGDGGTGKGQEEKTGFDAIADANGFLVAYPDSNPTYRDGKQWMLAGSGNDIEFSKALIAAIEAKYTIDSSRVYVSGFSMGAGMAQAMACAATSLVAGLGYSSNELGPAKAEQCHPSVPIAVVAFHGTADPVSNYNGGNYKGGNTYSAQQTAQFWATADGCPATPATTQIPDTLSDGSKVTDTKQTWSPCKGGTSVTFYTIEGGGHAWPGSSDVGKYGPASTRVDASQVIWDTLSPMRR